MDRESYIASNKSKKKCKNKEINSLVPFGGLGLAFKLDGIEKEKIKKNKK